MDENLLIGKLEKAGYTGVKDISIEQSRIEKDAHGDPFYPRDHQLMILRGRLRGCELYNKQKEMIPYLIKWITAFESITSETPIYYWEGTYKGKRLSGRCTAENILQIFPQ